MPSTRHIAATIYAFGRRLAPIRPTSSRTEPMLCLYAHEPHRVTFALLRLLKPVCCITSQHLPPNQASSTGHATLSAMKNRSLSSQQGPYPNLGEGDGSHGIIYTVQSSEKIRGLWEFPWKAPQSLELVRVRCTALPTSWGLQCPDHGNSERAKIRPVSCRLEHGPNTRRSFGWRSWG